MDSIHFYALAIISGLIRGGILKFSIEAYFIRFSAFKERVDTSF